MNVSGAPRGLHHFGIGVGRGTLCAMRNSWLFLGASSVLIAAGCGSSSRVTPDTVGNDDASLESGHVDDGGGSAGPVVGVDGGSGGSFANTTPGDGSMSVAAPDPTTCDQAAQSHSYVGCDYWPTITANVVWSIFDFAVVVANAGQNPANITVTGPSSTNQMATVSPGQLVKMYLPWVPALKGPDSDNCGASSSIAASAMVAGGAFHLVSSVPVTVYQFNALEYVGQGGPPGKNWSACPGDTLCIPPDPTLQPQAIGCYSFSNDASLLLPSTAMTGNYRVTGHEGSVVQDPSTGAMGEMGAYMAVTGTQNGTTVKVKLSGSGQVLAGGPIAATAPNGLLTFTLDAGDVAELVGPGSGDLSGSLVQATAPVQVITGIPCMDIPPLQQACDHLEESVSPAETLGKHYVVTRPTGPNGDPVNYQVRIYGNVDGTNLSYNPSAPPGCPSTIGAGEVVECGSACPPVADVTQMYSCGVVGQDFDVTGDQPFAVGLFTLAASLVDPLTKPPNQKGDPAQSFATAVEQYRTTYVFLAPADYPVSYADIVSGSDTAMTLDGQSVTAASTPIGTSGFSVTRIELGQGQAGAHVLHAAQPVGIQVLGYGSYTSYMYPGGLDLLQIAPPPLLR